MFDDLPNIFETWLFYIIFYISQIARGCRTILVLPWVRHFDCFLWLTESLLKKRNNPHKEILQISTVSLYSRSRFFFFTKKRGLLETDMGNVTQIGQVDVAVAVQAMAWGSQGEWWYKVYGQSSDVLHVQRTNLMNYLLQYGACLCLHRLGRWFYGCVDVSGYKPWKGHVTKNGKTYQCSAQKRVFKLQT